MLGEDFRGGLQQFTAQPLGKPHALAPHIRAGLPPQRQRLGVIAELDADLLEHLVGVALDQAQAFLVQHLVNANLADDEGHRQPRASA